MKVGALRRGPLAGGRDVVVWGAGPVGKAWARALRGAGHGVAAFVDVDPRKIGGRVLGAPVLHAAEGGRIRGPLHLAAVGQKKEAVATWEKALKCDDVSKRDAERRRKITEKLRKTRAELKQ